MAICDTCFTSDKEIKPDETASCGKCHADDWLEYEDFFEKWFFEFLKKSAIKHNITLAELRAKVAKSDGVSSGMGNLSPSGTRVIITVSSMS